jgi:hypothetical protein
MHPAKRAEKSTKRSKEKFRQFSGVSATMSRGNEVHDSKQTENEYKKNWKMMNKKASSRLRMPRRKGLGAGTGKRATARSKNQSNFL